MHFYDELVGIRHTIQDANGTWWMEDTRRQFNITLSDEVLDRLAGALGLNTSYSQVEVILSGYAGHSPLALEG